jgi:deoxyribodipyrimidine photo-lyase
VIVELERDSRVTVRRGGTPSGGRCVVLWMQRAQRAEDNPALDVAVRAANALRLPCVAFFAPVPFYPGANLRHYAFLAQGVPDIAAGLARRGVGFALRPFPRHSLEGFCREVRPSLVVGDENPLRDPERWRRAVTSRVEVPFWTVDADVVVPSRLLLKEQYAARTIRPRIHRLLPEFLRASKPVRAAVPWKRRFPSDPDWLRAFPCDRGTPPITGITGGTSAGLGRLRRFVKEILPGYSGSRNRPETDGTSALSPWLHFGHLSPVTVALAVRDAAAPRADRDAFLEQLIVRRELAVNFVRFNPDYDRLDGCEGWAKRTLAAHAGDERRLYTEEDLERAETHDPLWNAAQRQVTESGWMHNYLRMYWAKKILEWSPTPEEAFARAVRLNDRWELDGRDPNGYAGIAWAIGGKHDRAWGPQRPVFGTVRFMSYASTRRKFDSAAYVALWARADSATATTAGWRTLRSTEMA